MSIFVALAALVASVAVVWQMRAQSRLIDRFFRRDQQKSQDMSEEQRRTWAELHSLRVQYAILERQMAGAIPAGGSRGSDRRDRVYELTQSGEEPGSIAAQLEIPRSEVDLLLKVRKIHHS